MTTIHPKGLAALVATGQPVRIIDVRPHDEFHKLHIRSAHSMPLQKLHAAKVVRDHGLLNPAPLFLISRRSARAGLAAGLLHGAGCLRPVVMEGGMELWQAQGLPVVQSWHYHFLALAQETYALIQPHFKPAAHS